MKNNNFKKISVLIGLIGSLITLNVSAMRINNSGEYKKQNHILKGNKYDFKNQKNEYNEKIEPDNCNIKAKTNFNPNISINPKISVIYNEKDDDFKNSDSKNSNFKLNSSPNTSNNLQGNLLLHNSNYLQPNPFLFNIPNYIIP